MAIHFDFLVRHIRILFSTDVAAMGVDTPNLNIGVSLAEETRPRILQLVSLSETASSQVSRFRSNASVPSLSPPPTPTPPTSLRSPSYRNEGCSPFVKKASAQVSISKQSYIYIWVLRGARIFLIGCCVFQSGQRIDHSRQHCQEPGGHRLRHR